MTRWERHLFCRRCGQEDEGSSARPFVLPGARATYAPDRVCDVEHIRIEVALDFEARQVVGTCRHTLVPLNDGSTVLCLDAMEMEVAEVVLDGAAQPFSYDGRRLRIDLGTRKEGERLELAIRYSAKPRRGLYFIRPDDDYPQKPVQAWTQGQDQDNRYWFPCFDHPHERSTSEVIVTVPERMKALSNGLCLSEKHDAPRGTRTFHYRHDVPHSSYLVTLVAGEYVRLEDRFGDVEVYYYVPPGREDDASRTFSRTPEMMRLFSERTGRFYPYPRYSQITVADFIFGGMENTSATTLTDQTLHDERAHLDFSSESLVSHELAHQWFGDLLTCRDWSQGWLNEGFATYFEIVWKEHIAGRDEADYDRLTDQEAYFDEDTRRYRRAIVSNVFHEPIDVFDRHLYEKGSTVLHMLRQELGEARFWKGIRHYVARNAGRNVETRDLVRAFEEATGWSGDRFFEQWVEKAGYPTFEVGYEFDEVERVVRLSVKQSQPQTAETPLFDLPVVMTFVVDGELHERHLRVRETEEVFFLPLPGRPTQAIFDSGNHLLKSLEMKKPIELWQTELGQAERAIDRIFAARALGKANDPRAVSGLASALSKDAFWAARGEAALALSALRTEEAREALLSALPKEAHPKARRLIIRALAAFRRDEKVADALLLVLSGDASYFVEAEAALSLGKIRSSRAFEALRAALDRPSYLDVVSSLAMSGLAELEDDRTFELALDYSRYGRPAIGRRAAIQALGRLGADFAARRRGARQRLEELLDDLDFRARIAAVEALSVLGDLDAIGALARATERDLDGRVRRRAREVARALREKAKQTDELRSLRDQVEKLGNETRDLRIKLAQLESRGSAVSK